MSGCDGVGSGGFKQANIVASRAGAKRARAGMNESPLQDRHQSQG